MVNVPPVEKGSISDCIIMRAEVHTWGREFVWDLGDLDLNLDLRWHSCRLDPMGRHAKFRKP